jgi:2-polyprenyl-3-methyl-5-hydroxy-6-metoxy-1,4-benzoquinol methylase
LARIQTSNHAKYEAARTSPIVRLLMGRLARAVRQACAANGPGDLLDAGCGEGHALPMLSGLDMARYEGIDANPECVRYCREVYPARSFRQASVLDLPFDSGEFDVVLCMEVLEHLDQPGAALAELTRVARTALVLSVPFEPWFQLGNAARGKYLATLGNHPEHVQHWGLRGFRRVLDDSRLFSGVDLTPAGPWLVAQCWPAR